jgi:hypothetical protein
MKDWNNSLPQNVLVNQGKDILPRGLFRQQIVHVSASMFIGVQLHRRMSAHLISHFLLISLSSNRSLSQARESFDVWGVTPSCWNHCSSRSIPLRHPNDALYFANKSYTLVQACLLGYSSTGGCLAEVVTLNKVHSTGSHFETWHHRTILV